jgi:RHS repeat-associated protein
VRLSSTQSYFKEEVAMIRFSAAFILVLSLIVPAALAQDSAPITTQGIPPFSLISHAGGGIDSINLGDLSILLSIPINSNGPYGPKSSGTLMMESGFPLIQSGSSILIGNYTPFHLQSLSYLPAHFNFNFSSGVCTLNGAIDPTGAYHQTPTLASPTCDPGYYSLSVSGIGQDGWQIACCADGTGNFNFFTIAPDGTYSTSVDQRLFDLHANYTQFAQTSTAEEFVDAAGNYTTQAPLGVCCSGNSTNFTIPQTPINYPGPGSTTSEYQLGWNFWTGNSNANCGPWHSWYQPQETMPFLTAMQLPDQSYYSFSYEQYWGTSMYTGRIAGVTLPTGGVITYTYSGGTQANEGVWCDDGSTATITKTTPDGSWVFTHCEYGLATAPTTCNTSAPSGWSSNRLATTTVTEPSGDYKIYSTVTYMPSDPGEKRIYPVQMQSFGVTGPGCSTSSPCNLGSQVICYQADTSFPSCAVPTAVVTGAVTEQDVYTYVPGVANPSLTVYKYDSYSRPTSTQVYGFGGTRGTSQWDTQTKIAYGSWNGSTCSAVTGTITGTSVTFPVLNRVCSKQTFVGGSSTAVSTSYYTYDSWGDLSTQQDTIGGVLVTTATNTYDNLGRLTQSVGPNGETTSNAYTACSNQEPSSTTITTSASSSLTTNYISYDCTGERLLIKQDANGNNWTTSYVGDPFWRPMATTDPMNNTTSYKYTPTTKNVSLTVASGSVEDTLTQVDSMGRPQLSQVELNGTGNYSITETDRDVNGRVRRVTVPFTAAAGTLNSSVGAFTYTYDGLDRVLTETGPAYSSSIPGTTKTYSYVANDTMVTVSPAPSGENTKSTNTEVNGLGEVTSVCEITSAAGSSSCNQTNSSATGFLTTYSYYPGGKLASITQNATGTTTQVRSFTYDNSNTGRQLTATTPESGTNTTVYDSDSAAHCQPFVGFPVAETDNLGVTLCIYYDLADRFSGVAQLSFDGLAWSSVGKTIFYDTTTNSNINCGTSGNQAGAVAEIQTTSQSNVAGSLRTYTDIGYCYDADGRPTDDFTQLGASTLELQAPYIHLSESYFPDGQVKTLSVPTQPQITYGLDSDGRLYTATANSGTTPILTSTSYFDNGLPNVVTLGTGDTSTYTPYSNLQPWTAAHTIGTSNNNTITHTLVWNSNGTLGSLATSDQPYPANSQTCSFSYDDLERVKSNNCGTNWNESYAYDVFGNVTKSGSAPWPTSGSYNQSTNQYSSTAFTYDADGRLTNDTFDTLSWDQFGQLASQTGTTFVYDALGRTNSSSTSSATTFYVTAPDGSLVATAENATTILNMFVPLPMSRAVYVSGTLNHYDRYDWQGSARVASSASRSVYSDTSYDAFGIPYWLSGTANNQYAGLNSDISSGTEQVSATRRYHPTQGRWISPDSIIPDIHNPQSFNGYHYALNHPTNVTDPGGNCDDGDPSCGGDISLFGDDGLLSGFAMTALINVPSGFSCDDSLLDWWGTWSYPGGTPTFNPMFPWNPGVMPILQSTPITNTSYQEPITIAPSGFFPGTTLYPSQMSAGDLASLNQRMGYLNMWFTLGTAWLGGLGGGLGTGPGVQTTGFTQAGTQAIPEAASAPPTSSDLNLNLRLTESMSKTQLRKLTADIASNGLQNNVIKYVQIGDDNFVVSGNNRLQAARQLNITYQLQYQKVSLPYMGFQTEADVINSWAELYGGRNW